MQYGGKSERFMLFCPVQHFILAFESLAVFELRLDDQTQSEIFTQLPNIKEIQRKKRPELCEICHV